jgi:hypothetical protein
VLLILILIQIIDEIANDFYTSLSFQVLLSRSESITHTYGYSARPWQLWSAIKQRRNSKRSGLKKSSNVYVLNMRWQPLMHTTPRKAKKLLKEGKAKVFRRTPFTTQLKYATGENRKIWYRQPRFLNRKKPECWLAPSIQHKHDSHIKLIDNVKKLLTTTRIDIEVAAFDIQKCNRKLFKGDISHIRNTAPRFIYGFQRYELDGKKVHA